MRWLFLLVLTLNLGYFAWQSSLSGATSELKVAPIRGVDPIVLLSEIEETKEENGGQLAENDIDEPVITEEPAQQAEKVVEKAVEKTAGKVVPPKSVVAKPVVTKPALIAKNPPKTVAANNNVTAPTAPQCYSLGPFRDLDKLRRLTRDIKSYVTKTDFRGKEEKEQTLYWVYLKPEKSHASALATAKRLKARKIKDYYVIKDGEKAHGVSLGHFRNKQGAYGLAKRVTKLGFTVLVEPVYKTYTLYWLDYQLVAGKEVPKSVLVKYIGKDKNNKINTLKRDCLPA